MRAELSNYLFQRLLDANVLPPSAQLREYRLVLESLFGALTRGEGRYFDSLYARMHFVFDKHRVSTALAHSVHAVRKKLFARDVEQDELTIIKKELALAIAFFSGLPMPDQLISEIEETPPIFFTKAQPESKTVDLLICVKSVSPLQASHNTVYFQLRGDDETFGDVTLTLKDDVSVKYAYLHAIVQPYHSLRVIGATCRESGSELSSLEAEGGLVVLEPDILLDISDLAECFDMKGDLPLLFIVKKLVPQATTVQMFSGTMVNAMFDAAVRSEDPDLVQTYRAAAGEQAFQSAVFGKEELVRIYSDIKTNHWHNLKEQANRLRARQVRIEPSFMSDTFGLQGRLDCLVEDAEDRQVKDILELKSGTPPVLGSYISNKMQVTGYNLLLRSAFGKERKGSSVLFYSKAQESPLRDVLNDPESEHRLLTLRNQVIHLMLRLAEGDASVFEMIHEDFSKQLVSFKALPFITFSTAWHAAEPVIRSYYKNYIGFLCREYLSARTGAYSSVDREDSNDGFAALWRRTEMEKKHAYSILTNLNIISISEDVSIIELKREPAQHSFRQGDMVIFYPKSGALLEPMKHQFVKARIAVLDTDRITITLNFSQISRAYFESFSTWVIEPDIYDKTYWSNAADLFRLLTADREKQQQLMGLRPPALPDEAGLPEDTTQRIIEQAFRAKDYFLIQGPPGTGKTSQVLTEIVRKLNHSGASTVVVAFTNRAVDEIALQLEKRGISFLKLGSKGSGAEKQLKDFCLEGQIDLAREHVQRHQVFLSTVASMSGKIDSLIRIKEDIHTLIVDEASQLTEPQISGMICRFRKFILIGDQNQLPPVVTQDKAFIEVKDASLTDLGLNSFGSSLFERLINQAHSNGWTHAFGMLEKHYRMHEEIAGLVNPWYGHKLITGSDKQRSALSESAQPETGVWDAFRLSRKLFISSAYDPAFKVNKDEVEKVVSLLTWIKTSLGEQFDPLEDVGVITPWRTQIAAIRERLSDDELFRHVQVDTIERYQGSEKRIIIVSMAISHSRQLSMIESSTQFRYMEGGDLKTVEVERKLLVTLSRAKERILLLGYKPALMQHRVYAALLSNFSEVEIPT